MYPSQMHFGSKQNIAPFKNSITYLPRYLRFENVTLN